MSFDIESLKVFTLNCWGLKYVSEHRKLRIELIAQHLTEHEYDIVFLQEVWVQSDFEYIRTKTESIYKFAHIFNNASILGTSGLVILAKWMPTIIHFLPYSINGSPFKIKHGDWFSTKGVAYVRIELKGLNLHLFCTHMHAQYDPKEKKIDQYSIHRVCQSYELANYINLMSCNCSSNLSKDLIIVAGDMNSSSKEWPYRLLVEMTDLKDCYKYDHMKKLNKLKFYCSDESSDEDLITCGHKDNAFSESEKFRKRIDFILYKLKDSSCIANFNKTNDYKNLMNNGGQIDDFKLENTNFMLCFPEQIKIVSKDETGLSFSDHQPVVTKLTFSVKSYSEFIDESNENFVSNINDFDDDHDVQVDHVDNNEPNKSKNNSDKGDTTVTKCNIQKLRTKLKHKLTEDHVKSLQLKQLANEMVHYQFPFNSHQLSYKKIKDGNLLPDIEDRLQEYINKSSSKCYLILIFFVLFFAFLLAILFWKINLSLLEVCLIFIISMMLLMLPFFGYFFTTRTELNAIKAILSDIRKKKSLIIDYSFLENQ